MRTRVRYPTRINDKGAASMTASTLRAFALITGAMMATGIAQAQQAAPISKPAAHSAAPSAPASSQSAQKPAADTSANGSKSAQAVAPAQKTADPDAQLIKDARNAGFKPQVIRGTQMFCRTEVELGSSFPVRTCYDADQVKIKIHEYAEERSQLEQMREVGQPP